MAHDTLLSSFPFRRSMPRMRINFQGFGAYASCFHLGSMNKSHWFQGKYYLTPCVIDKYELFKYILWECFFCQEDSIAFGTGSDAIYNHVAKWVKFGLWYTALLQHKQILWVFSLYVYLVEWIWVYAQALCGTRCSKLIHHMTSAVVLGPISFWSSAYVSIGLWSMSAQVPE